MNAEDSLIILPSLFNEDKPIILINVFYRKQAFILVIIKIEW